MNEELRAIAGETFAKVLEKQAFIFVEEGESSADAGRGADAWNRASIAFTGPFAGRVAIVAPRAMALELAANYLGLDSADPSVEAGADDSFRELLNVVCGHLLTGLVGEEPIFDLEMPAIAPVSVEEAARLPGSQDWIAFQAESHPVYLRVELDGDWRGIK